MNDTNLKNGDAQLWRKIFLEHIDFLNDYGMRIWNNEEYVKDAIQDVFLSLYERRDHLSQIQNLKAYLSRAIRNKLLDKKKIATQYSITNDSQVIDFELTIDFSSTIEEHEYNEMQTQQLDKMLHKLTNRQREFIFLKYYNGFSNEEIAVITGVNKQSVANSLYESLRKMKDCIAILIYFILHLYSK